MPVFYHIFEPLDLVEIRFAGALTTQEMLRVIDRLDDDPAYHPHILEMGDFTPLESLQISSADLANLTGLLDGMYRRSYRAKRVAQIAPTMPGRGVAEVYAAGMAANPNLQVEIFDTRQDALRFLGLLPDEALPPAWPDCA